MKQSYVPIQDHFPSLHSETINQPVLSVLWFDQVQVKSPFHIIFIITFTNHPADQNKITQSNNVNPNQTAKVAI